MIMSMVNGKRLAQTREFHPPPSIMEPILSFLTSQEASDLPMRSGVKWIVVGVVCFLLVIGELVSVPLRIVIPSSCCRSVTGLSMPKFTRGSRC